VPKLESRRSLVAWLAEADHVLADQPELSMSPTIHGSRYGQTELRGSVSDTSHHPPRRSQASLFAEPRLTSAEVCRGSSSSEASGSTSTSGPPEVSKMSPRSLLMGTYFTIW
jgi:hypothetical protein